MPYQESWIDKPLYSKSLARYVRGEGGDLFTILCPLSLGVWLKKKL